MSAQTQQQQATTTGILTIGVDLGDRRSSYCVLDQQGEVIEEGVLTSTPLSLERHFQKYPRSLVAIEVCFHSRWASQVIERWQDYKLRKKQQKKEKRNEHGFDARF